MTPDEIKALLDAQTASFKEEIASLKAELEKKKTDEKEGDKNDPAPADPKATDPKATDPAPADTEVDIEVDNTEVIKKVVEDRLVKQTLVDKIEKDEFLSAVAVGLDKNWKNLDSMQLKNLVNTAMEASKKLAPAPVTPPKPKTTEELNKEFKEAYKKQLSGRRY